MPSEQAHLRLMPGSEQFPFLCRKNFPTAPLFVIHPVGWNESRTRVGSHAPASRAARGRSLRTSAVNFPRALRDGNSVLRLREIKLV
jgi:hypothetical protein